MSSRLPPDPGPAGAGSLTLDRLPVARVSALTALRGRWFAWRDALLGSARFQAWSSAFPLTRPMARRRANQLFDLCAGFVYSQILLACVELDLFDRLRKGPRSAEELAAELSIDAAALDRLMTAAAAIRLLRIEAYDPAMRYGLGDLGAALIGNPGVIAMIQHHRLLYQDLRDPVAMLRGEGLSDAGRSADAHGASLSGFWPYAKGADPAGLTTDRIERYTALMAASQDLIARQVIAAYPLARQSHLLDVGGGDGTFLAAVARAYPSLQLSLFDLPAVADIARARSVERGLSARIQVHGGSFVANDLPTGADIVSLVRIVHDHDDDTVRRLLRAVNRALPPGGVLLIAEPMAGTRGGEAIADAYFGMYLLAMGSGKARRLSAMTQLLAEAGFDAPRRHSTHLPALVRVITCRKLHDLADVGRAFHKVPAIDPSRNNASI